MVNSIEFGLIRTEPCGTQIYKVLNRATAAEMKVPAGYVPVGIWAARKGYTKEQASKMAGMGRLWVTKDIAATMRVGHYRFVHLNATVRPLKQYQRGNNRGS